MESPDDKNVIEGVKVLKMLQKCFIILSWDENIFTSNFLDPDIYAENRTDDTSHARTGLVMGSLKLPYSISR